MTQSRLALLIPDRITRSGIEGLIKLDGNNRYEVVVFEEFDTLMRQSCTIDILLMDTSGLGINTVERQMELLLKHCHDVRIIVISNQLKVLHIKRIMQVGARGFIFRDDLSKNLLGSIDLVAREVVTMSSQAMALLTTADQLYVANDLKSIDLQILRLTARGLTVKGIATELEISTRSVYRSRDKLREVLDVQTIETLIDAAREQGLLDNEDQ